MSATEEILTELLDERERIIDKKDARIAALEAALDKAEGERNYIKAFAEGALTLLDDGYVDQAAAMLQAVHDALKGGAS
jgi:hypothetical protein